MDIEKRLENLKYFETTIRSKQHERNRLGSLIAQNVANEPYKGFSAEVNRKYRTQCDEIEKEIEELGKERAELIRLIDMLDPFESAILRLFYVEAKTWKTIEYMLRGRKRNFQRIKRGAIRKLNAITNIK
ncbi:TPA: DUF1492 domain-containing protein [Streptococcus suis]